MKSRFSRALTQGIGLDIRPFAAGRWLHTGASGNDTFTGKPGLDLFYNFTPSLKLTATVNTDFGETEVDARQINLTRFSLLFPEKRSFFLEDAGVFSFASTGGAYRRAAFPPPEPKCFRSSAGRSDCLPEKKCLSISG